MTEEQRTESLGEYLKRSRLSIPMSLRAVEGKTEGISNGYLSQIESNQIKQPSPNVLFQLSEVYGLDYRDLLVRAQHRVPTNKGAAKQDAELGGIPLRALSDLTDEERKQVTDYIAWLKTRR